MVRKLIHYIAPPPAWRIPVAIVMGAFVGVSLYLVKISNAASYLSDAPETCMNCHVMAPQYATWNHSAHREVTNCNDCHVPHNNLANKIFFKAKDGLRHSAVFTMRKEPQVIRIKQEGIEVVQQNCIRCHHNLITDSKTLAKTDTFHHARQERLCWECHRETPHGRVNSLSSVPNARIPLPSSAIPNWLKERMEARAPSR